MWGALKAVVIVWMAVATLATPALFHHLAWHLDDSSSTNIARTQTKTIGKSVEQYKLKNGRYPTSVQGLDALVNPPQGTPVMDRLPRDPWGKAYVYRMPGVVNVDSFDVVSAGPDGKPWTEDDIGNWTR